MCVAVVNTRGGGIDFEMGTVYSTLGGRLDVVVMLKTKTVSARALPKG